MCYSLTLTLGGHLVPKCWRRKWQPTPVFLPGESHGQRSLVGYSPWGRKESDTIERLHYHYHQQCYANNLNTLEKMHKFLETYNL